MRERPSTPPGRPGATRRVTRNRRSPRSFRGTVKTPRPDRRTSRRQPESTKLELESLQNSVRELEVSHEAFIRLYDFAPVGYLTLSGYGAVLGINLPGADILGFERNQIIGVPMLSFITPADRRAFLLHLHSLRKQESHPVAAEFCVRRQNREEILVQFISQRGRDISQHAYGVFTSGLQSACDSIVFYCVIRDVTSQRDAEGDQRRLAAIVRHSEDAVVGKDLMGTITSWNRGAEILFGYRAQEAIGESITLIIPSIRAREESFILQKIRRGEPITHFETVRRRKNGSEVQVSLTISPVRDAHGQVISAAEIARDITERKAAEEALRRTHDELEKRVDERTAALTAANAELQAEIQAHRISEAALRESEARLQAILDNSPELIFLKDKAGRYLLCNRRFQEAFHLPSDGVIGKTDFAIFSRAEARLARKTDWQVLETGQPLQFESMVSSNGESRVGIVSKFPVHDTEGKVFAVGGIVTDITERRRLEGEVLRISEHEQQRIARDLHDSLGQQIAGTWFLSDILRKNLAAQSSSELPTAKKVVELLQSTVSQTRNLAIGLSPVSPQPEGLMDALRHLAGQVSGIFKVDCHLTCHSPVLIADNSKATHLYRIAQEAVNNAVHHGQARTIEIGLSAIAHCVILRVKDNGMGFRKDAKKKPGMGLRTMRYRADLMGADFAIYNRQTGGTEIVCKLPEQHGTA